MNILNAILIQFKKALNDYQPSCQAFTLVEAQVKDEAVRQLIWLSWLKGQSHYPQFYWRTREQQKVYLSIGKVRSFSDLLSANQFTQQYNLSVVGGVKFNGQAQFYLPRLLLIQDQDCVTVSIIIDNQLDFAMQKKEIETLLQYFEKVATLSAINQPLQMLSQAAQCSEWQDWVVRALQAIEQGEFRKVVLANASYFAVDKLNGKDLLAESERQNTGCYHFLWAENADNVFLGSTPERLYWRQGTHLYTEALAGTAAMGENEEENQRQGLWLLRDEKNLNENTLVVDDICQNLADLSREIHIGEVELKKLRNVQHLRRQIHIILKDESSDCDCLSRIHPTAAVSGLPQVDAMQFIQQTENFDRTWYAGALGVMNKQEAEFCVTIRSAVVGSTQICVFAGAGIVAGSDPQAEWQEIERKAAGLVSLLQRKE